MKKILFLGGGPLQLPAIQNLKDRGHYVICADYDEEAPGFSIADEKQLVSTIDLEGVYRVALHCKPDVIMTSTSDMPVRTVAYVREQLGMPLDISYENALCATNKAYMRRRLSEYQVPIPKFFIVESLEEYRLAVSQFNSKYIVKPADNAASRGVMLVEAKEKDWERFYDYAKQYSRSGTVLVEEYLEGEEVSVESFTVQGNTEVITITDKLVTPPPYFVELGHVEPSRHSIEIIDEIKEVTKRTIEAVGIINGPSHTEVKITTEGVKVVEIAARMGGDYITSRLVPLSTGVDMTEELVSLSLGEKVDVKRRYEKAAAILFLPTREGVIDGIYGVDVARGRNNISEIVLYKQPGDIVGNVKSSNDRIGHIIATGQTASEAEECCRRAYADITVRYQ